MSSIRRYLNFAATGFLLSGFVGTALGATPLVRQGTEYRVAPAMLGDQLHPRIAISGGGGYLVWQDNATDGNGLGISARRLDATLNGALSVFRVNEIGAGDQENPQVCLLKGGGAMFVWQGGSPGSQRIYARFLKADGTFASGDVQVNTYVGEYQCDPVAAVLDDGNVIVLWGSFGQDGNMQGVYGQRFSPVGARLGAEFRLNQSVENNQRTPDVVALPGGRFLAVWVTETYTGRALASDANGTAPDLSTGGVVLYDVRIVSRLFDAAGTALSAEQALTPSSTIAANPSIAVTSGGQLLLSWSGRRPTLGVSPTRRNDGWDVYCTPLTATGGVAGPEFRVNSKLPGDQFLPKIAAVGEQFFVIYTTFGQDGSREGVFGRVVDPAGLMRDEVQVNTRSSSQQIFPAVAALGSDAAVVTWSSFIGGDPSFDLFAQRFALAPTAAAPSAPYVTALSQTRLSVTWPEAEGLEVAAYLVYVDGSNLSTETTEARFTLSNLQAGSTHAFRLAYRLANGEVSPASETATGSTWAEDANFDGLPDDWQALYWPGVSNWPAGNLDSDGDGASNLQEFLAGTNPKDAHSVLRLQMTGDSQSRRLVWNTQPGSIYQVQVSSDLGEWSAVGGDRFAAGSEDSIAVDGANPLQMYRIIRIR